MTSSFVSPAGRRKHFPVHAVHRARTQHKFPLPRFIKPTIRSAVRWLQLASSVTASASAHPITLDAELARCVHNKTGPKRATVAQLLQPMAAYCPGTPSLAAS